MYQYAARKECPISSPVYQFGRGKYLLNGHPTTHVIKMNFAGSGNLAWNKKQNLNGYGRTELSKTTSGETCDFNEIYGTAVSSKPNLYRKEKDINEVVFSIAGPQKLGGTLDAGENSIQNNVNIAVNVIKSEIEKINESYKEKSTTPFIHLIIKGHSRGGVAAGFAALALRNVYPPDTSHVSIDLVMYDPVPGPGHNNLYKELNLRKNYGSTETGFLDLKKLNSHTDNSTVVYSLCDQYWYADLFNGFTPQKILGADRVIFTPHNHSCGLNVREDNSRHKQGFRTKNKTFLAADINKLGRGRYFADSNGYLTILQKENWEKTLRPYTGYALFHRGRNQVLKDVITDNPKYKRNGMWPLKCVKNLMGTF